MNNEAGKPSLGWYYQAWKAMPYGTVNSAFDDLGPLQVGPGGARMPAFTGAAPTTEASPISIGVLLGIAGVMLLINIGGKKKRR